MCHLVEIHDFTSEIFLPKCNLSNIKVLIEKLLQYCKSTKGLSNFKKEKKDVFQPSSLYS